MPRERAVRRNVPAPLRFPSTNGLPVATLRYVHRAHSPSPISCKSKAAPQLSFCSPAFLPQGSTKHRHHTAHWSSVPDSVRLPDRPSSSVYRLCRKRPASPPPDRPRTLIFAVGWHSCSGFEVVETIWWNLFFN